MVETLVSTWLWERRTEGERGGETVVSERWAVPTYVEREKGSARKGGAVELWERRTNGGLRFGLKVEPYIYIYIYIDNTVIFKYFIVCMHYMTEMSEFKSEL